MTDMELAEEIELVIAAAPNAALGCMVATPTLRNIIAALRRGPEPFMLDCLAGKLTTWEAICGYVSKLELQLAERPPSGEMSMEDSAKELRDAVAGLYGLLQLYRDRLPPEWESNHRAKSARFALATYEQFHAAEAEGRKG